MCEGAADYANFRASMGHKPIDNFDPKTAFSQRDFSQTIKNIKDSLPKEQMKEYA